VPEVRRLLAPEEPPERFSFRLDWSTFRRRHQAVAKAVIAGDEHSSRLRISVLPPFSTWT
jgi:hypothetical protein